MRKGALRPSCRTDVPGGKSLPILLILLAGLNGSILTAQEEPAGEEEDSGPRIAFHGYLTQAYAQSDGHQFFGITEDGTADYRTAALQVRADIGENDAFVAQFSHERFGASRIQELKEDVELDWIFYQHKFGDSSVKVGRIQIPMGLYNEVRDVGTLLPFYRPSHNFYGETAYSSETVDGIVLGHEFRLSNRWSVDADLHYGNWEFISRDFFGDGYRIDKVDDSLGAQLMLNAPLPGLRVGAGAMRYDIRESFSGTFETWKVYHASLGGDFRRFAVHAEVKEVDIVFAHIYLGYAHLGFKLTDKLTLNAQWDFNYVKMPGLPRIKADEDRILGINYAFTPALVFKAEHHWDKGGFSLEDVLLLAPAPTLKARAAIVSLSTSF